MPFYFGSFLILYFSFYFPLLVATQLITSAYQVYSCVYCRKKYTIHFVVKEWRGKLNVSQISIESKRLLLLLMEWNWTYIYQFYLFIYFYQTCYDLTTLTASSSPKKSASLWKSSYPAATASHGPRRAGRREATFRMVNRVWFLTCLFRDDPA